MSWSGGTYRKGNYLTNGWTGDAASGIGIEAGRHDTQDDDFATGINSCLNKDGSNSMTGNLNMGAGTYRITNLANGTGRTDALNVSQLQDGSVIWCGTSGGAANAQTLTPSPAISSYVAGQVFRFIAGFTSTSTLTLQISGIAGPKNCLMKGSATAFTSAFAYLIAGGTYEALYDGTNFLISNLLDFANYTNDAAAARLKLFKSRATTFGTNTIVQNGDGLGQIDFFGANGTSFDRAAYITAQVDGTPGASADMPSRLVFATSADGSATAVERMRIDNAGNVGTGGIAPVVNLHVHQPSAANTYVKLTNTNSGSTSTDGFDLICDSTSNAWLYNRENTNMYFLTNSVERMRITNAGQVLIARTTANQTYDVLSAGSGSGQQAIVCEGGNSGTAGGAIIVARNAGATVAAIGGQSAISGSAYDATPTLYFASAPKVHNLAAGVGTWPMKWNTTTFAWTYDTSRRSSKDNIRPSIYGLEHVLKLLPRQFNYLESEQFREDVGFIADEVYTVIPELAPCDENGEPSGVSYDRLTSVLCKAIQELNAKVEALEARVAELEA